MLMLHAFYSTNSSPKMAKLSTDPFTFLALISLIIAISLPFSTSQPQQQPPTNITGICNGIQITYTYNLGYPIPPIYLPSEPSKQPYRFQSTLTLQNNGLDELKSWRVFVGFKNKEFLVSASQAVLADGTILPADVSNGTVFAGSPVTELMSAVETAGDFTRMQARVELVGTEFGVGAPNIPMPSNVTLINEGYSCSTFNTSQGNNVTSVCCIKDLSATPNNATVEDFEQLQDGDLTIMYDVLKAFETDYWAQVTISNHNPNSRIDNWQLSWDWMRDEFINSMKGAYPTVVDTNECIFGRQGQFYQDLDFSTALSCERRPTIIDHPIERTNDTDLGMIPFCCRDGTILPSTVDPRQSKSAFVMHVYKMQPDLNRTEINPPQNWMINGTSSPDYQCSPPVRVDPSLFPNPSGLSSEVAAVASWQVVCNITRQPEKKPKCCVSFSAFYNDSAVPCNTCACGCSPNTSNMCSATEPAVLTRPDALLIPFDNRTLITKTFAKDKRQVLPNPLPCGDNCGVSINWHLLSDFEDGWTARISLFNWDKTNLKDWFATVELDKAMSGFEAAYSMNGTILPDSNDTLFLYGFQYFNYLIAEKDPSNPRKDYPVPGSQQSVISFKKKETPGIKVARGDGFPSKVFFNGEECSLPLIIPSFGQFTTVASTGFSILLSVLVLIVLWQ